MRKTATMIDVGCAERKWRWKCSGEMIKEPLARKVYRDAGTSGPNHCLSRPNVAADDPASMIRSVHGAWVRTAVDRPSVQPDARSPRRPAPRTLGAIRLRGQQGQFGALRGSKEGEGPMSNPLVRMPWTRTAAVAATARSLSLRRNRLARLSARLASFIAGGDAWPGKDRWSRCIGLRE